MFVFILTMSSAASLSAQTSGTISGHVADPTGASFPMRTILKNVSDRRGTHHGDDRSGDYAFADVPPGIYNITATHSGFKTATSNDV